jgi:hypothetical protein
VARSRKWSKRKALLGALTTASGHIALSLILAVIGIQIGSHIFKENEATIEHYAGLLVALFGLIYAGWAYFRHSGCHGHTHHGPKIEREAAPFLLLLFSAFSPCVAALPIFAADATISSWSLALSLGAFAIGVISALVTATLLVFHGVMKLDHPVFEHYGDVITGLSVALVGIFFSIPILILGTMLGAVVAEKLVSKKTHGAALKSGVGAAVGFVISTVARFGCAAVMIALFLISALSPKTV